MCEVLEVSRSGYYAWRRRMPSQREVADGHITDDIKRVFFENKKRYGSPRIYHQLKREGVLCGRHRIARIMQTEGLIARRRRRYKKPVSVQRTLPVAANVLNRNFMVSRVNTVWASDVTYFWTRSGWIHLAVVIDLYSRRVIGWSMKDRIDAKSSKDALEMAIINRSPKQKLLHHSDQGAEYSNKEYQSMLNQRGFIASMSRKANCYDNAVVESFFKSIKAELGKQRRFDTKQEAKLALFEYIEIYYNRKRLHSTLGYRSPEEFEKVTIN